VEITGGKILLKLYVDGASRGNPGPAGIGFLIMDEDGSLVVEEGQYIGETTNNVAEYRALIAGIRAAISHRPEEVRAFSDSQLLVRQINGEYRVRHENLIPLYQEAMTLIGELPRFQLSHISRRENKEADALANRGIDHQKGK
jgi:ribonuclease HI